MRFYDREQEIAFLRQTRETARRVARFTVVTGRRRIGKTTLIREAYKDEPFVYFFVARKAEADLCETYLEEISEKLGVPTLGSSQHFSDIFRYLMQLSQTRSFTLVIDEFQDFFRVNRGVFSEMQDIWDEYEKSSRINLVVSGSIYSLMQKIFKGQKEPLYGRNTGELRVKPFRPLVLKQILADAKPAYVNEDLLALFTFTGGVAKYVSQLIDTGALDRDAMIRHIVSPNSIFLNEGKNSLIDEFGKDYGIYFSILSCIARGRNTRSGIEDVIGKEVGGYLTNLEKDYELIVKRQPLFEKSGNRNVRYEIDDVFYNFWFRFIFKYGYIIEIENYAKLQEILLRDYTTFSGLMLERYFHRVAVESGEFTRIGRWWDRRGENEIDLIAEDELSDKVKFCEVKRRRDEISIGVLKQKAEAFLNATREFKGYKIEYEGLSMDNM